MKQNLEQLRKTIRKLIVDEDLGRSATADLASALGLNKQSFSMAMTGYRTGPKSLEMLIQVKRYLRKRRRKRISRSIYRLYGQKPA